MAEYIDMEMDELSLELLVIIKSEDNLTKHQSIVEFIKKVEKKFDDTWIKNPMAFVISGLNQLIL